MIINLFSIFDPCTGIISLNWLRSIIIFIILPYKFWIIPNSYHLVIQIIINKLNKEVNIFLKNKGTSLIILSLFILILINNIIRILPYIFTSPAHLNFSLALSLPLWLSLIIFGWINKTNSIFRHLLPISTPPILIPFIIIIETIRNIIRPGSLAVRLSANIIAGHLIISLLGNNIKLNLIIPLIIIFMLLIIFEFAVSIIQSYVFITLSTLYYREI